MSENEQAGPMTAADREREREAQRPDRELKLMHQLKMHQVHIDNLQDKLRIAELALSGFGLKFVDLP